MNLVLNFDLRESMIIYLFVPCSFYLRVHGLTLRIKQFTDLIWHNQKQELVEDCTKYFC